MSCRPKLKCHSDIIKECFRSHTSSASDEHRVSFLRPFPLPLRTCAFFYSLCFFVNVSECIYFSWRQKSEWHTVVHQSQSSDMVIKSPRLYKQWLIGNTHTHALRRAHTDTEVVTSTTKQHKQKALFDKSHRPKHSIYSSFVVALLYTHSNSPSFSSSATCPVVLEALCEAYCGRLSSSAQIASASYSRRRRKGEAGRTDRRRDDMTMV